MVKPYAYISIALPNTAASLVQTHWRYHSLALSLPYDKMFTCIFAPELISSHYIDVIMTTMASQITSLAVVYSIVYSGVDKKNIKAPRHWPLCGEFTGTGEFPAQRASYAENVSIWWRHHVLGSSQIQHTIQNVNISFDIFQIIQHL